MLPDLIRRGREPSVGITVHEATITLRITAAGRTPEECLAAMGETEETIHRSLGNLVFGSEDDELEDVVAGLLSARKQTVADDRMGNPRPIGALAGPGGDRHERATPAA